MENGRFVDQRRAAVQRYFADHRDALRRQGVVVATYRRSRGRRLGPYFQLVCRVAGRQVALYLGTDEELLRHVRQRLSQLQSARTEDLQWKVTRRELRRQARLARRNLDVELALLGLRRQGHEIRGWRNAESGRAESALRSSPSAELTAHGMQNQTETTEVVACR